MRYTTYYVMAYLVSITFAHFPVKVSLGLPLYIMQSVAKKDTKEKIGTVIPRFTRFSITRFSITRFFVLVQKYLHNMVL